MVIAIPALSANLNDKLNYQLIHELRNANIYSAMQSYFEDLNMKNIATYFKKQSEDERSHFNIFLNLLNDRIGGKVKIDLVDAPPEFTSLVDLGLAYLTTEQGTSDLINDLIDTALDEKDYISYTQIFPMVSEQYSEEDEALWFKSKCDIIGDDLKALLIWDENFEIS